MAVDNAVVPVQVAVDIVLDTGNTESVLALFCFVDRPTYYTMAEDVQRGLLWCWPVYWWSHVIQDRRVGLLILCILSLL